MSDWTLIYSRQAQKDAKKLATSGLKPKATQLLEVIAEDPFATPPRYEKLVGVKEGDNFNWNGMEFTDGDGNKFTGYGMFAALSYDEGETWPVRKLLTPGSGSYTKCGGWTGDFTATPTRAEPDGYLTATQTPDGVIHLLSSAHHYRFNLGWVLEQPVMD